MPGTTMLLTVAKEYVQKRGSSCEICGPDAAKRRDRDPGQVYELTVRNETGQNRQCQGQG